MPAPLLPGRQATHRPTHSHHPHRAPLPSQAIVEAGDSSDDATILDKEVDAGMMTMDRTMGAQSWCRCRLPQTNDD